MRLAVRARLRSSWRRGGCSEESHPKAVCSSAERHQHVPHALARCTGEKTLRTLLTKTPEWSCAASRQRAAAAVLCTQPELASALQRRDVASLRKAHFFALCGLWHYKSDVWVDRAQAKRLRVHSAGVTSLPQPQPLLLRLPGCTEDAVAANLACQLSLYVRATDDSRVHAAALREPLAPVLSWNAGLFDAFIPAIRNFVASTSEDARQLGARCCAHDESTDAWWLSDARELLMRADAHLMLLQTAVGVYGQGMGALRAGGDGVSAVDRAALVTWQDALAVLNRFVSMSQSALALARIDHKADQYQLVTSKVVTSLSMLMRHMLSVFEGRRDWCLARGQRTARGLAGAGDGFTPLLMAGPQDVIVPMARAVHHSEIANSLVAGVAAVKL